MGLLTFTKRSRKQGQSTNTKPFEISHHIPSQEEYTIPPPTARNFKLESSVPKEAESSLMDDIMNELGSARTANKASTMAEPSRLSIFDLSPPAKVNVPASPPSEKKSVSPVLHAKQQRPKPLISFDNNMSDTELNNMQRNMTEENTSADNEPVLYRSPMRSPMVDRPTNKAYVASSPSLTLSSSSSPSPSTPPAQPVATNSPTSKNLMDRMKERHRQEARRSLQTAPFMDTTQMRNSTLSSPPSMPMLYSPMNNKMIDSTLALKPSTASLSRRPLVQSHSFSTYVQPNNMSQITLPKRHSALLKRSVSAVNEMYNASGGSSSRPIQTQSDISLGKRLPYGHQQQQGSSIRLASAPSAANIRNSYLQTGPVMLGSSLPAYESALINGNAEEVQKGGTLHRSASTFSVLPTLQQQMIQQQELQQQQLLMQQQQQIQHQIEMQQQQLQEQQRLQQQKLHQLQIQHQQQESINQALLESASTPLKIHQRDPSKTGMSRSNSSLFDVSSKNASRPLYERSSSPASNTEHSNYRHHHHRHHRHSHQSRHHSNCRHKQYQRRSLEEPYCNYRASVTPNSEVVHNQSNESNNTIAAISTDTATTTVTTTPKEENKETDGEQEVSKQQIDLPETPTSLITDSNMEETLINNNSSSSTLTEDDVDVDDLPIEQSDKQEITMPATIDKYKPIRVPIKVRQELHGMQIRRSPYSVPNLSALQYEEEDIKKDWTTVDLFFMDQHNKNDSTSEDAKVYPSVEEAVAQELPGIIHSNTSPRCHHHHHHHHHRSSSSNCCKRHNSSTKKHRYCCSKKNDHTHCSMNKSLSSYSINEPSIASCSHHQCHRKYR